MDILLRILLGCMGLGLLSVVIGMIYGTILAKERKKDMAKYEALYKLLYGMGVNIAEWEGKDAVDEMEERGEAHKVR